MAARVFASMARVFQRTFGEPGVHYWKRHDAAAPVVIDLIFNSAQAAVDADGIEVVSGVPTAWIAKDELLRLAPSRASKDPSLWVDNDDTLTISGTAYAVERCRFDGNAMCEVTLYRKKTA